MTVVRFVKVKQRLSVEHLFKKIDIRFKGIVPQFFLSIKSHILDTNGVWYCSFWEGFINPLNLTILRYHVALPFEVHEDKILDQNVKL